MKIFLGIIIGWVLRSLIAHYQAKKLERVLDEATKNMEGFLNTIPGIVESAGDQSDRLTHAEYCIARPCPSCKAPGFFWNTFHRKDGGHCCLCGHDTRPKPDLKIVK